MDTKKIIILVFTLLIGRVTFAQVSGNVNYMHAVRFPNSTIQIELPQNSDFLISVKGLANVKADTYVAIFSVTQTGKTAQEVNELMDLRISQALTEIKTKPGIETYLDMISFVPVYEFELEKKVFSKKTYNEVPAGFELKKNIHIKYSDPSQLNQLIAILAANEIYDLVRVDYISNNLEAIKKDLQNRARVILQERVKNYETILGEPLVHVEKQIADGYAVNFPVEMYKSYEAFNSSPLKGKKSVNVNQADKSLTLYYQPIMNKEFDFVVNPTILEPVIQVLYEIKIAFVRNETPKPKEYVLITPAGEMKNLGALK